MISLPADPKLKGGVPAQSKNTDHSLFLHLRVGSATPTGGLCNWSIRRDEIYSLTSLVYNVFFSRFGNVGLMLASILNSLVDPIVVVYHATYWLNHLTASQIRSTRNVVGNNKILLQVVSATLGNVVGVLWSVKLRLEFVDSLVLLGKC